MSLPCIRHTISPEGLFGLPIRPFGLLVATGVMLGYSLGRRRAERTGLDPDICANGMVWTVFGGFIGAHLVSVIFYFPEDILENPWVLLHFWKQLSSFGGFVGGALGAFLFFRKERVSLLKYAEAILFGLVPGWVFGRMGCTVVHDHPGLPTDFFLGVRCGVGGAVEHDLGLYELLFTVVLTAILYGTKAIRPFYGFHLVLTLSLYAPVRFMLDFLRTEDRIYGPFTPGQYFAISMVFGALAIAVYGLRLRARGERPGLPASGSLATVGGGRASASGGAAASRRRNGARKRRRKR